MINLLSTCHTDFIGDGSQLLYYVAIQNYGTATYNPVHGDGPKLDFAGAAFYN